MKRLASHLAIIVKPFTKHGLNEMFDIDPNVIISENDAEAILGRLREERSPRVRQTSYTRPPRWTRLIVQIPTMVILGSGVAVVVVFGSPVWAFVPFLAIAIVCSYLAFQVVATHHYGPLVRRELKSRGYDICIHCGYWLRGIDGAANCPECGKPCERTK